MLLWTLTQPQQCHPQFETMTTNSILENVLLPMNGIDYCFHEFIDCIAFR